MLQYNFIMRKHQHKAHAQSQDEQSELSQENHRKVKGEEVIALVFRKL